MNTLERSIENKSVIELEKIGCIALKFGQDGWPDRLVLLGKKYPRACIWIEFKNATGTIRPGQKIRKRQLNAISQTVVYCRSYQEALGAVAKARRAIDRANKGG